MDKIIKILAVLAACFPSFSPQKETYRVYAECLADIEYAVLEKAIKTCMMTCRFFPSIAEIREEAAKIMSPYMPTAMDAWSTVMSEVRRVHFFGKPEFENPLITRLVNSIGWRNICMTDEPEILRAHFLKAYDGLTVRYRNEARLPESMRYHAPEDIRMLTDGMWDRNETAYTVNEWQSEEWRKQLNFKAG